MGFIIVASYNIFFCIPLTHLIGVMYFGFLEICPHPVVRLLQITQYATHQKRVYF